MAIRMLSRASVGIPFIAVVGSILNYENNKVVVIGAAVLCHNLFEVLAFDHQPLLQTSLPPSHFNTT